tara:strand:+ start:377 stop:616 length:240 start_codon:yes stop_codon:yes gene_type:complete
MTREEIEIIKEFMRGLDLRPAYACGEYWECIGCNGEESIVTDYTKPEQLYIIHEPDCEWIKIQKILKSCEASLQEDDNS